jgi:acetate kinase
VDLDQSVNATGGVMITRRGSRTSAWVIPTDEDLMIALHAWTLSNPEAAPLDSHANNESRKV